MSEMIEITESSDWTMEHHQAAMELMPSSAGIARRLRVIGDDLRAIGNALDGEGSTILKTALREHASELLEVADWLDSKKRGAQHE